MKCSHARHQLSAYLDRDLTFQDESDLKTHLEACADCNEELAQLEGVQRLLGGHAKVVSACLPERFYPGTQGPSHLRKPA